MFVDTDTVAADTVEYFVPKLFVIVGPFRFKDYSEKDKKKYKLINKILAFVRIDLQYASDASPMQVHNINV